MDKNQSLGDRFKKWCVSHGRPEPPQRLVDAMNNGLDTGDRVGKELVAKQPGVYRAMRSFLARMN